MLGILLALGCCVVLTLLATGASNGTTGTHYWVALDDAFGLVSGGDLKIAGVRAGTIGQMKVDQRTHRALVEINITKQGFGSIRTDVTCQARPESLIGEYFLDCQPGTAPDELKAGSTIPVSHTSSVVAPDLVNDVLRQPYRQRFSIILDELGAAVAGNAQNLNDAIRRASPGLRETDKVLKVLGNQNHILADLVTNADKVIGDLADNRGQVARWVTMADRTSAASAARSGDIAKGFAELPGFLEQLRPAMAQLSNVTTQQTPALQTLTQAAPDLKTFFDRLGPFADASRPAFRALGQASLTGSHAARNALSTVQTLNRFAGQTPELGQNLDIVLKHLDNRRYSAELDPRSPGGKGYTGLEALLEYVYDQVLSVNIYDSSVHILKVSPFASDCAHYADIHQALSPKNGGKLNQMCGAGLGPNQTGINSPDPSRPDGMAPFGDFNDEQPGQARSKRRTAKTKHRVAKPPLKPQTKAPATHPNVPKLSDIIPGAPNVVIPSPPPAVQQATQGAGKLLSQDRLLNYLLGG